MMYDLKLISEMCTEMGFTDLELTQYSLNINLYDDVTLVFQNIDENTDCLVAFDQFPWHAHGDLMFSDKNGNYIEIAALDIIEGLKTGIILICDRIENSEIKDRYLVHKDMIDEFDYLEPGERINIQRVPH